MFLHIQGRAQIPGPLLTPKTFLDLPAEIHHEILKYLDIPSTACLRLVSRHLYELVPPISESQVDGDGKFAIRKQLYDLKLCKACGNDRPRGAFPHLISSAPENSVLTGGLKGWLERGRQATENKQRIGKRKALMTRYGLTHQSPAYSRRPDGWILPRPWVWADGELKPVQVRREGAKHIQLKLPRGGWVQLPPQSGCSEPHLESHLFEYRGFCGWTYHGQGVAGRRWSFCCECLRCSAKVSDAHNKCCWCDVHDSRYPLLRTSGREQRGFGLGSYNDGEPGRILFRTEYFPYGRETSWVGRRKNTCPNIHHYQPEELSGTKKDDIWYFNNTKWEERELPSWNFSWCGICDPTWVCRSLKSYPRYSPMYYLKRRTAPRGPRECARHAFDPEQDGWVIERTSKTFRMHLEDFFCAAIVIILGWEDPA